MENTQTPLEGVKMYVAQVFEYGPEVAVVVYRVEIDDTVDDAPPLQDFYVAALNDGNLEVVWGSGVTPEDALEVASREWDYLYSDSPVRANNPFREALGQQEDKEEETND